jgi:NarL family two-component system sensor histidine kinase LiaS
MYSVRTRFGGLYWRLASSYFAVTLLAAVIIEIAITLPASMQGYQQVSATPYGKTPIPTSPAQSGVSHISLFLSIFWDHLQDNGLYVVLLAGVVGTLTGLLITRNVTRRLRRITQAAEAWSNGEFTVEVRDPTRDEIGQLGQDLNGMAEQLHTLLATREELAAVEERNRLARDLHDSIKQNVFAPALLVGAARTHLPTDTLPAQSRRMGIAVAMHIQDERGIALDIEEALFRLAQEALANVAHHSGAAHVTIHLAWDGAQVQLTIADDGAGFDVAHANGRGVGLTSMRERVTAHDGSLTIASASGATTVEAIIPLHDAEETTQEATP